MRSGAAAARLAHNQQVVGSIPTSAMERPNVNPETRKTGTGAARGVAGMNSYSTDGSECSFGRIAEFGSGSRALRGQNER